MCFDMAEAGGVEPHPLLAEPGFQGQSQDHPRCISFHLAGASGLEPEITDSKSAVLPLHYAPTKQLKFLKNKKP